MKKILPSLIFLLNSTGFAASLGVLKIDGVKRLDPLSHTGSAQLSASKFSEKVEIKGRLQAESCQFSDEVTVEGRAQLKQILAVKNVNLKGSAEVVGSNFKADLSIEGDEGSSISQSQVSGKTTLIGNEFVIEGKSQLDSIEVSASHDHPKIPVLILKTGSRVLGTIRFNNPGKVVVESGAEIHQVINGDVVQK